MLVPEATELHLDDFIALLILPQNKENCWKDSANSIKFRKKNPNLFLNWDLIHDFIVYPLSQASFKLFFVGSVTLSPSFSS